MDRPVRKVWLSAQAGAPQQGGCRGGRAALRREKARKHLELHIKDDYEADKIPSIRDLRGFPRATDGLKERKEYVIDRSRMKEDG